MRLCPKILRLNCRYRLVRRAGFIDRRVDEIAERAAELEGCVVPIDLGKLAASTLLLCNRTQEVITVGASANDIVRYWPEERRGTNLPVATKNETRNREARQLEAGAIETISEGPYCLVDDVAVSGLTLAVARDAVGADAGSTAVVGMAWDSRRLRRRVGMDLLSAIRYRQEGGGKPAINTLATLAQNEERRKEYAQRRFGNSEALEAIVKLYQEGEEE